MSTHSKILKSWEEKHIPKNVTDFSPGDTVRVYTKIYEAEKERIQPFEGIVTSKRGRGLNQTFTIRHISSGIGVEKTFPMATPVIDKIKLIKKGVSRRAKLYYLRYTKKARIEKKEQQHEEPTKATPSAVAQ